MFGLSVIDLVVLVLYFGVIFYIGIRASMRVKNREDYFLGGRKFGKLTSTFASFGQATSADGPVGVATTTFTNGASGIWSSLLMLFVTPLFWITSPWLRRLRILTMGDFYEERYGSRKMAATYALIASIGMMGLLSVGYLAVTRTAMAMTPKPTVELTAEEKTELQQAERLSELEQKSAIWLSTGEKMELETLRKQDVHSVFSYLNEHALIWSICLMVMLYTALGGLEAAFYTDMLQGVFIIILSIVLIPFAWSGINSLYGGSGALQALTHLHDRLPDRIFEVFGSPQTIDFTWYFIATVAVVSGITVVTQPNQLVTAGAAKDEYAARVGFVTGTFMKRVVTIMWGVTGIAAILLYSGKVTNSDLVWGYATVDLLGPLNIGLVGLMLASMMAALMSTADCLMITVSGLLVNNLYKPFFPNASENRLIWVGRIAGAGFLIGGAIITLQFDNILQVLKFVWEFFVIFAAAFWLGLKWRKANRQGAWISIMGSFSIFYLIPILIPAFVPQVRQNEYLLKQTNPAPIVKTYEAKPMDVEKRTLEIEWWKSGDQTLPSPEPLEAGENFEATFNPPSKPIFWSKGIKESEGTQLGGGYLYLELVLLDRIGFDLAQNPYALNETIRMIVRLLFPFILLVVGSLMFRQSRRDEPTNFFVKMRMPVHEEGAEADRHMLDRAMKEPESTEHVLAFPQSDWEFYKWSRRDWRGFILSWGIVLSILGLLWMVLTIGN